MIRGIGVDLCSIDRIRRFIRKRSFRERVFSEEECRYAQEKADPARHFASAFAAKEAFAKAGGWGLGTVGLQGVAVTRTEGRPYLRVAPTAQALLRHRGVDSVHLSLSHDGLYAIAVVVLEGRSDDA